MVLSVTELPIESDAGVLPQPVGVEAMTRLQMLLDRRITEHLPLPYLQILL